MCIPASLPNHCMYPWRPEWTWYWNWILSFEYHIWVSRPEPVPFARAASIPIF